MHELTLATEMIRQIETILDGREASRVVSVKVDIGALSGVEAEPLSFCFPVAAQGTVAQDARLDILETPVSVACSRCGSQSEPEAPAIYCVECGSTEVEIVAGRDFVIRSLEVC
jgi:hydrogenase nickel incorporation protein HypA/HybF